MTKEQIALFIDEKYPNKGEYPYKFAVMGYEGDGNPNNNPPLIISESKLVTAKETFEGFKGAFIKSSVDATSQETNNTFYIAYAERNNQDVVEVKRFIQLSNESL